MGKVWGIILFSLLPATEALLCHEHCTLFTSHPHSTKLWVWLFISQLLSSFCRKQAQCPTQVAKLPPCSGVAWELRETLDSRIHWTDLRGNDGVCPSALRLYILRLNTWHQVLDTWLDFLNIESSLIIFVYVIWCFGTCIPSEKLLLHLESEFIHHHHKCPRAPLKLISSWPLQGNPTLQANTSLFSVTIA